MHSVKSVFKFIIKLLIILNFSLLSNSALLATVTPTIAFPDWRLGQAKDQIANLQKEGASLQKADVERSLTRGKEAMHKKEWTEAAQEYARIVGQDPSNRDAWVNLSLALQRKNQVLQDWRTADEAKFAALNLYLMSKTPEEQAEALLIYGNNFSPDDQYESPSYHEIYEVAQSLTDIAKLKQSHPDLITLMAFNFQKIRVNNQATPPNVCFNFSHPIVSQNVNYADFFNITPKVDGSLKASGRDLCFSPVQFGVTYDVTLKTGIKDIYGDKTHSDLKLSFKVKDQPSLLSFKTNAYVLRKEEKALIPLSGVNVDSVNIKILRINDRSLEQPVGQVQDFLTRLWDYSVEQIQNSRGELLFQGSMDFSNSKNETVTKLIPFNDAVKKTEPGVYIVYAEEKGAVLGDKATATQWVIVSDLGLTTFTQSDGGVWVSVRSLQTAMPLENVEVKLLAYNNTIIKSLNTNKDGMAFFGPNQTKGKGGNRPLMVLAYGQKNDFSFLSLSTPAFDLSDRGVSGRKLPGALDAFLYTEQGVYRPGDKVHVNTLLRDDKGNAKGGLPLTFKISRSDDVVVSEQTLQGNELGFYELLVPLQGSSRTGVWTALAYLDPKKDPIGRVQFSVEDFVPSRVTLKLDAQASLLKVHDPVSVHILAKYLFGAPAGGLEGNGSYTLRARPNPFPKWPGYRFGLITDPFNTTQTPIVLSPLDKEGKGEFAVQIDKMPDSTRPLEAVIKVSLSDKGGRPELGSLTIPVESSSYMLGIKPSFSGNVLPDSENNAIFDIIAIDEQQNTQAVSGLQYELYEERPQYTWYHSDPNSSWQYQSRIEDKFLAQGSVATLQDSTAKLSLPIRDWGQYRLEIRDPKTRVATSVRFNKGYEVSPDSAETPDKISVKVNQDSIQPNGSVELQIDAPFEGQALLTIANNKVLETRNIAVSRKGTRLKLTANTDWGVGVYCMVSAYRPLTEKADSLILKKDEKATSIKPFLPKRAIGLAWVGIDPSNRLLKVDFELPSEVKPRQTVDIPFTVSQNDKSLTGKTQISIAAVDEGILKLTDFHSPKPEDYFFGKRRLSVELRDLYGKLIDPLPGVQGELRVGGDAGLLSRNLQALSKRSFKVVSLYQGLVDLDKNGKGQVQLTLPDFDGSLRLMAVAFSEQNLGAKEAVLLVRDPIVVEGVMPRFLAPQDKSRLALSLHNVQAPEGQYHLNFASTGPLKLMGEKAIEVKLLKNEVKDFELPITAEEIGDGSIRVTLTGNGLNLERIFEITVRPLQAYQLQVQSQFLKPKEEFKLTLSGADKFIPSSIERLLTWSTIVPWDTRAIFKQLADYPYGCVEQATSKAIGALYDGNDKEKNSYNVGQIIAGLSEKQSGPGYYVLWNSSPDSGDVFLTSYVMDFLLRAQANNNQIPQYTLARGLDWLAKAIDKREYDDYALTETAYAMYVLTKADRIETGALRYFFDTYFSKMKNPIARAFLGTALAMRGDLVRTKEAYHHIMNMTDKPYESPYGTYLRDKLVLISLMQETLIATPSVNELNDIINALIPAIHKEIQLGESTARLSTQELAWAVLAANSMVAPGQESSIALVMSKGGILQNIAATAPYSLPLSAQDLAQGITIKNEGNSALWQNLLVSGLPKELPKAESSGITIDRQYYTPEGEKISAKEVKQGSQCVVVLEGSVADQLPHQLLLLDLLPAGFEIDNSRLGQEGLPATYSWLESVTKADYTDSRDDRFVASILLDGTNPSFRLAYMVTAVTPGTYHAPGFYVEDMYAPTFFARTEAKTVEVTAR